VVDLLFAGKIPDRGLVRQEQVRFEDFVGNRFGSLYGAGTGSGG
jgi:hypothetical protein